jgi:ABC-type sulfate transport system substrate-binding protein
MERGASGLLNSTGNMMREMILKGPSSFDALLVYENVAIDYLKNAEGRWGQLRVAYPSKNMWNDNPYYILDVPWSSAAHREAAEAFLEFLMTEPIQKEALAHGFRPGNPSVPIKVAGSPFESLAPYGVRVDLGSICEAPKAEVINNLLASWQRNQGSR